MTDQEIEIQHKGIFESIKKYDENGNEYWFSRELSKILGYSEYRHFQPVIERAKQACKNSNQTIESHFEDILHQIKKQTKKIPV